MHLLIHKHRTLKQVDGEFGSCGLLGNSTLRDVHARYSNRDCIRE